jgi:hypothetical protein
MHLKWYMFALFLYVQQSNKSPDICKSIFFDCKHLDEIILAVFTIGSMWSLVEPII